MKQRTATLAKVGVSRWEVRATPMLSRRTPASNHGLSRAHHRKLYCKYISSGERGLPVLRMNSPANSCEKPTRDILVHREVKTHKEINFVADVQPRLASWVLSCRGAGRVIKGVLAAVEVH